MLLLYVVRAWALMCMWVTARLSVGSSLPFLFLCCGGVGAVGSLSDAVGISRVFVKLECSFIISTRACMLCKGT